MSTSVAVVMPAFNEEDGISGFISEVLACLDTPAYDVSVWIADDRSTDRTAKVVDEMSDSRVTVSTMPVNRGHGPTALSAYRLGLESGADVIVHVDGDGQFRGDDIRAVVDILVRHDLDLVQGVRQNRTDPWFRKVLTGTLRVTASTVVRKPLPDINTPLRAYRSPIARELTNALPPDALVPHVHFTLAEARWGIRVGHLKVESIPRRGGVETGTMWGSQPARPKLPPRKLIAFSTRAAFEAWRLTLAPRAPLRKRPPQPADSQTITP